LWETEDIKKHQEECIASLYHDDREDDDKIVSYGSGPSILKEEVKWVYNIAKP